jgi:hypothetical protein
MKKNSFVSLLYCFVLVAVLVSCNEEDKYTIENKPVTGSLTYTQTGAVPVEIDPVTQQPLKMQFSFEGIGTMTDMGELTMESSFIFDFVAGQGYDFVTTYTGTSASDNFSSTGSSVMTGNMVFTITETFTEGKGKFEKIKGGGEIHVELLPDGSSGTGDVAWTVTY